MIEWLALPLAVAGAALIPKGKMKDERKLQMIFENNRIGVERGESFIHPKLQRKIKGDTYNTLLYKLPLGVPSEAVEELFPAIREGLNKEVEIEHDGLLKIDVFHTKLPEKWKYTENLIQPGKWEVPIGKNHKGILFHDFDKYAHFLIGGVPGFGKTVFMKSVFHTLLMNNPDDVEFYILDLKGGLEFYKYKGVPQVKEVACNVYEAAELLNEIVENMKKMEEHFRSKGYTNINETPIKKRTFILVDEGAELAPDIIVGDAKKYAQFCQSALSEIARIGRAVGFRLIYGTQYPSAKSVNMSIKMNIVARISFVAASQVSSRVILDEIGAEDIPTIPGRAIYKVEKKRTVQVPYIDDKMMFKMMEGRKDAILNATESGKSANNNRPAGHGEDQTPTANS